MQKIIVKTGYKVVTKIQPLLLIFISCILITLLSILSCSDPSHTGSMLTYTNSMLTPSDVDEYLISNSGGTFCIHDESESACIDIISLTNVGADANGPIIHIYPERVLYMFYHEGRPILRAERIGDTTDFVETLTDADEEPATPGDNDNDNDDNPGDTNDDNPGDINNNDDNPDENGPATPGDNDNDNDDNPGDTNDDNPGDINNNDDNPDENGPATPGDNDNDNDDNPGDTNDDNPDNDETDPPDNTNTDDGHGWIIWVYYPEGTAPQDPPTLSESGVTVTINGKQLTDDDITGFAQFIGPNNEVGIQFFYETKSAELLDLKVRIEGIVATEDPVKFNINYLWNSQ